MGRRRRGAFFKNPLSIISITRDVAPNFTYSGSCSRFESASPSCSLCFSGEETEQGREVQVSEKNACLHQVTGVEHRSIVGADRPAERPVDGSGLLGKLEVPVHLDRSRAGKHRACHQECKGVSSHATKSARSQDERERNRKRPAQNQKQPVQDAAEHVLEHVLFQIVEALAPSSVPQGRNGEGRPAEQCGHDACGENDGEKDPGRESRHQEHREQKG